MSLEKMTPITEHITLEDGMAVECASAGNHGNPKSRANGMDVGRLTALSDNAGEQLEMELKQQVRRCKFRVLKNYKGASNPLTPIARLAGLAWN
jgi:hypothetical protein